MAELSKVVGNKRGCPRKFFSLPPLFVHRRLIILSLRLVVFMGWQPTADFTPPPQSSHADGAASEMRGRTICMGGRHGRRNNTK